MTVYHEVEVGGRLMKRYDYIGHRGSQYPEIDVHECGDCGAVVTDMNKHDSFHRKFDFAHSRAMR